MKNINLDLEKILKKISAQSKILLVVVLGIIFLIYSFLTYLALFPKEDASMVTLRDEREAELKINFDKNTLEKLSYTDDPAEISGSGARNPFMPF